MASKPITRQVHKRIADAGGERFVFGQVAEGATLKALARELGISRQILSAWANAPSRRDMLAHARQEQAHSLVEEALEITDTVEPETAAIQKAKLQSDLRRWMAGHISREDWGADRVGATLNINVGGLHLDALRQAGRVIEGDGS